MNTKKNDFSSFVWKGEKRKEGDKYVQDSIKIVDMSPEQLKKCYEHCEKMLHNEFNYCNVIIVTTKLMFFI